jgi:hypothetical protein
MPGVDLPWHSRQVLLLGATPARRTTATIETMQRRM